MGDYIAAYYAQMLSRIVAVAFIAGITLAIAVVVLAPWAWSELSPWIHAVTAPK